MELLGISTSSTEMQLKKSENLRTFLDYFDQIQRNPLFYVMDHICV